MRARVALLCALTVTAAAGCGGTEPEAPAAEGVEDRGAERADAPADTAAPADEEPEPQGEPHLLVGLNDGETFWMTLDGERVEALAPRSSSQSHGGSRFFESATNAPWLIVDAAGLPLSEPINWSGAAEWNPSGDRFAYNDEDTGIVVTDGDGSTIITTVEGGDPGNPPASDDVSFQDWLDDEHMVVIWNGDWYVAKLTDDAVVLGATLADAAKSATPDPGSDLGVSFDMVGTLDPATGEFSELATVPLGRDRDAFPSQHWSPAGRAFATYAGEYGAHTLHICTIDSSVGCLDLDHGLAVDTVKGAQWAPDGSFVVFSVRDDRAVDHVLVARLDGSVSEVQVPGCGTADSCTVFAIGFPN